MKIIGIGYNYRKHVIETKKTFPKEPIFFLKPETAIILNNRPFFYPDFSKNVHYEVEILLRICKVGKNIQEKFANTYFDKIGIGIDITARDLQDECKKNGLPWEKCKGFDGSAPISSFIKKEEFKNVNDINFHLNINGKTIQKGNTDDLIFSFEKIISHVSKFMTLKIGDVIFTGTPAGIGPLNIGDKLEAFIEGNKMLSCMIK
ncbi:MAG: fumarylacetoacetate hydrolase family protein [Bacteroidales bacterium]|jgi:2-keto-4-pentenoate hydratase/2-oxohepta-3-ene-1,7-dioic acid hydratase in catechol pathway